MVRRCHIAFLLAVVVVLLLPCLYAVERSYQTATLVGVQQKHRSRVLYYIVNTPVTQEDPFYQVSVQLKNTIYEGESASVRECCAARTGSVARKLAARRVWRKA